MIFRPGTWDSEIYRCVADCNEYQLQDRMTGLVVDVGAHIGSFGVECLRRGADCVLAYEADRANYHMATLNLMEYASLARVTQAAVWRSDRAGDELFFCGYDVNTGGGNVMFAHEGVPVHTIGLDDILRNRQVTLLKLDCEGAEFPILLTSLLLSNVEAICGEYHECGGEYDSNPVPELARVDGVERFDIEVLTQFLCGQGFAVRSKRAWTPAGPTNLGHFWAVRH